MDRVVITTDSGERVEAVAPVVISASRATDIPAFYAEWFFRRLERGYCVWVNPFSKRKVYVSFMRCKVIVFWTKNPAPIMPYLHILDRKRIHYYFQFTINDYEQEGLEPRVPSLGCRVDTARRLAAMIGAGRVVWRFDPMLLTPSLTPHDLLARVWRLGNMMRGCTEKLVFSFVDVSAYRRVASNLRASCSLFAQAGVTSAEPSAGQRLELAVGLARMCDRWASDGWKIDLATCAEEDDFGAYGISHNCCIDGTLIERLFGNDPELVYYLHSGKLPLPDAGGHMPVMPLAKRSLKDRGQRKACGCMVSKDIGMYSTCGHLCAYCYANGSRMTVERNMAAHNPGGESLCG